MYLKEGVLLIPMMGCVLRKRLTSDTLLSTRKLFSQIVLKSTFYTNWSILNIVLNSLKTNGKKMVYKVSAMKLSTVLFGHVSMAIDKKI